MFVERMRFVKALDQPRDEETIGGERMSKKNQQAKNFESFNTSIPNLTGFWLAIRDTSSNVPFFKIHAKLSLFTRLNERARLREKRPSNFHQHVELGIQGISFLFHVAIEFGPAVGAGPLPASHLNIIFKLLWRRERMDFGAFFRCACDAILQVGEGRREAKVLLTNHLGTRYEF
ncbi:hypothetical protein OUZ56_013308 [Daphnia magna]|uniref:Uncharacterized protein n=1 Tax=Daphnia magna TaxID=35525 RepID=A0ABQ9Z5I1_9CRUS|nr:hypothetical protein OUZ56_013308 [Daphnia magna]